MENYVLSFLQKLHDEIITGVFLIIKLYQNYDFCDVTSLKYCIDMNYLQNQVIKSSIY